MNDKVRNKVLANRELALLANRCCQWWNITFIQAKRFLEVLDNGDGVAPWDNDENKNNLIPERALLIISIFHALEDVIKLNIELKRSNNLELQYSVDEIEKVVSIKEISDLRNMTEHGLEYMLGEGHKQEKYIQTNANWTIINGTQNCFLLGNVPIDKLLIVMKEQHIKVKNITKTVFESNYS